MSPCQGRQAGRVPGDHDAEHVAARLVIPWDPAVPWGVEVVHRCGLWGCNMRGVDVAEPARDPEGVLRKLLGPRGMLGCSDDAGEGGPEDG